MHIAMSVRILEQFTWLFEIELWLTLLVAASTGRLAYPGRTIWASYLCHIAVALSTVNTFGKVHITLAIGLKPWVARITSIP